jgi:CBS domain-containing protein
MKISTILADKGSDVVTVAPDHSVKDLLALLSHHKIGALVVSVDGNAIIGIVSERDIVWALAHSESIINEPVSNIMSTEVFVASIDSKIDELMDAMTSQRIRHIPITSDSGELLGIVSIGDLVKARLDELETERAALMEYITNGG